MNLTETIGLIAGSCTTLAFIPQLKKVYISKSTADISLLMYSLYCTGLSLWTIYGILIGSLSLILANFVTFLFALGILVLKLKFDSVKSRSLDYSLPDA